MAQKKIYKFIVLAILFLASMPAKNTDAKRVYLNPHEIYARALSDPNFVVTGVYGTPVGGNEYRGWGSANNGYEEPNFDPWEKFLRR